MAIVIILFLIMVGFVFYYNVLRSQVETEVRFREDLEGITLAKNVLGLDEVRCTVESGRGEGCIDVLALKGLAYALTNNDYLLKQTALSYYNELLGPAIIDVHLLSGTRAGQSFRVYDNPPDGTFSTERTFLFTTLYDPVQRTQDLAYIDVTRYLTRRGEI
ncbi:hypothetical protein D6789_04475 [Candidatus Woesearchaeota archaeon]|nr:MAG: hypothetical protein D6789_04475 [Candidatus Woesearchaeota archaeon]